MGERGDSLQRVKHDDSSSLAAAFTEDHRHFTRGLSHLLEALERDDLATAVELAEALDRVVGPHIEFEEEVFYPEVARALGSDYVHQLYHEHRIGQEALRTLLSHRRDGSLAADVRDELLSELRTAMDHALSCGTLLSQVTRQSVEAQERMLERRREMLERGHRWTELPARRPNPS